MEKRLTELVEKLRGALGGQLVSVILYGSAARQDHHAKYSDLNVLCVLREVSPRELRASEPVTRWWRELGNPSPLMLSTEELESSSDCFAIEFQDMQESRRVLYGEDAIANLKIGQRYYRAQVEHELRSKQLRLRQRAAGVLSDAKALTALMLDSVSTFFVLARHALKLSSIEVEPSKRQVAAALPRIGIVSAPFDELLDVREGKRLPADVDAPALFAEYLKQIEALVRHVDGLEQ
ncbi:MAG TPA: nucleotidyltransferase domain-containing protein [Bryobacteraceae bacterium]|jgi:hypothetical protein|nr:nucleotidyltransferase domain-containing protein [Bryobacteraceae bacterium]